MVKILFLRDIDDFSFEKNYVIIEEMDINIILIMDENLYKINKRFGLEIVYDDG